MNPIYTFAEEYEKELAVASREFDIAMTEARAMEESTAQQLRINMALSELKVMQENGTVEDLAELIMEAGEEAAQENQGVLAKVFSAIGKFFKGIVNGITKFFTGGGKSKCDELAKKGKKITVDSKTNDVIKALQEAMPGLEKAADAKDHATFLKILGGIAAAGGIGAGLFTVWKKTKGKLRDDGEAATTVEVDAKTAEGWLNWLKPWGEKISNIFEKACSKLGISKKDDGAGTTAGAEPAPAATTGDASGVGNAKPGAADAAHQRTQQMRADKAAQAEANAQAEAAKKEKEARKAAVLKRMTDAGKSPEEIQKALAAMDASKEDIAAARIERNKAKAAVGANFIGMFEASEAEAENGEGGEVEKISFIKTLVNTLTSWIQKAIDAAYAQIGGAVTAAAAGAAAGAVGGLSGAIMTGNVAGKPKNQQPEQPQQTNNFIGDIEESGTEIDPIEAMLSGMAFGGYHG